MHKLFVIGAFYMAYLLMDSQLHAETAQGATQIHDYYEVTLKQFGDNQSAKPHTPMMPDETHIAGFPKAINVGEMDNTKIVDYYMNVSKAYEKEAQKIYESLVRLHNTKTSNHNKVRVNAYRHEKITYPKDLTTDKATSSTITPDHPFTSGKHVPDTIRRNTKTTTAKDYNTAKKLYDDYTYKADFYKTLAEKFTS